MVPLNKLLVASLFSRLTEDETIELAKSIGANTIKNTTLFVSNDLDLITFLKWFELRMKNSTAEVIHSYGEHKVQNYSIKHDLGKNWSLYNKIILESIFSELFQRSIKVHITDSIIKFKV